MTEAEYKVLLARLVGYDLPPTVVADIEAYRGYCEKHAWDSGLGLGHAASGQSIESLQEMCPYGR